MNLFEEKGECNLCEFKESLDLLRQSSFLAALPLEALKLFAYLCGREIYRAGEDLVTLGEDDGKAFLIIEGTVCLMHSETLGESCLRRFEAGEFIGYLSLLGEMPRLYTLRAHVDTECLVLTRDRFFKAMRQFPDLWPRVFTGILKRIVSWEAGLLETVESLPETARRKLGVSLL